MLLAPSQDSGHDLDPQAEQKRDHAAGLPPDLNPEDVTELVELYLRFIHDKPHSPLPQTESMERHKEGSCRQGLAIRHL